MEGVFRHTACLLSLLAVLACDKQGAGGKEDGSTLVPVQLAVRVSPGDEGSTTRGNPSVISEMEENFRGITSLTLLAFDARSAVFPEGAFTIPSSSLAFRAVSPPGPTTASVISPVWYGTTTLTCIHPTPSRFLTARLPSWCTVARPKRRQRQPSSSGT